MKQLRPDETLLVGDWHVVNGRVEPNEAAKRIDELVAGALERVGASANGWCITYRDPHDGRYWELSYPRGWMQGGGPPTLRYVDAAQPEQHSPQG